MRFILILSCFLTIVAVSSATAGEKSPASEQILPQQRESGTTSDIAGFIDRLRASGADVQSDGEAEQPFFSIAGKMIEVDAEYVQVFQFADTAAADGEAAPISQDGMEIGASKIHWIGSPHFFRQGRLIVLYVGDNAKVLMALKTVLGRQFAGK